MTNEKQVRWRVVAWGSFGKLYYDIETYPAWEFIYMNSE